LGTNKANGAAKIIYLENPLKKLPSVAGVGLLLLVAWAGVSRAAASANKVVIAYSSLNERGAGALLVARDQGFFRKYDLDVQLIFMRSGAVALSALSAGEAQFYSGSANGSALGAMAGGLDLVFVAGLANQLNGTMVAAPAIHSPADLKNKNIAIQSIGGGVWMITQLVLEHWGLEPKRDRINLRIVGDESVMVQSLVLGTVDATYAGYAYATMLKKQGFRVLADLTKLGVPFQSTAILARRSYLSSSSATAEKVVRALVESIAFIPRPANKAAVVGTLTKGLQMVRPEDAEEGYEVIKNVYERRVYPNIDGINNAIRLLGLSNEKIRQLKGANLVDDSIVKKLAKEGLF
jgi:ABC-type nitrate/sulfonate/bicarbonate transport system substrate-binding protein